MTRQLVRVLFLLALVPACGGDNDSGELELGTATVEGSRRLEDPKVGSVVLRGADAVTFDVAAATDDCVPYTLSDGTSGQACEDG